MHNNNPIPRHQMFDRDHSGWYEHWYFCPVCGAGWRQWTNERPNKAKEQAQECIDRHCCITDGKNASHMIIGIAWSPEQNAQFKKGIEKAFNSTKRGDE